MKSFSCITTVGTLLGLSLFSFGVVLLVFWSSIFEILLKTMLVLKPNSQILELWRKAPMPLALDFYFFNWTNPQDIYDLTTKPKFVEMGPYRFIEHREKVNLTWNDNGTVTYRLLRYWYFDEENSYGKLSDQLTTLNVVTMSAAHQVNGWSYFMKRGFSLSLAAIAPQVHITKSIGELLFDGYQDPYVDIAIAFPFLADTLPPFDKFGWFYARNGSYTFDGVFNMDTGEKGNIGELYKWNYDGETSFFQGSCAKVHGSGAELYPRNLTRDHIGFFSPDMCRHVKLDYEEDVVVKDIFGYKFSGRHSMLDNGTLIPENECYCNGECVPSGLLNISACRYGTPSFVSLPHFYGADPMYLSQIEGLKPNKSKHELFITLEPKTAAALDVAIRLQLNILLYPIEYITIYEDVPKIYFPMLWFEQAVQIPDNLAWMTSILLNLSTTIVPIFSSVLLTIGILILCYIVCKNSNARNCIGEKTFLGHKATALQQVTNVTYVPTKRKSNTIGFLYSS